MKERPMLMSAPMVRAILAGTKTQTRRVVKPQPHDPAEGVYAAPSMIHGTGSYTQDHMLADGFDGGTCPYGQPGERLWVRETWAYGVHAMAAKSDDDGPYVYAATNHGTQGRLCDRWRPSIHMPRAASRITLEITSVRVERLQDISEADAIAEGITRENVIVDTNCNGGRHSEMTEDRYFYDGCDDKGFEYAVDAYAGLWESINGPGAWSANPWVWAIEFKRVTP
jgi:hypothetical protein